MTLSNARVEAEPSFRLRFIRAGLTRALLSVMAGHLQYAALGIVVVIFGAALLILTNRRPKLTHSLG